MQQDDILKIFTETGAFIKGHFELSSGLHSDEYVQCALVLQYPHYAEQLAHELALFFKESGVTCVIGPALGGVTLAYEVARQLGVHPVESAKGGAAEPLFHGVKALFAERKEGNMQLRRGFSLSDNDSILVVEDVITTGGSVKEVITLLEKSKKKVVGVGSLINRSHGDVNFGYPFHALLHRPLRTFSPAQCPFCAEEKPLSKPGSKSR